MQPPYENKEAQFLSFINIEGSRKSYYMENTKFVQAQTGSHIHILHIYCIDCGMKSPKRAKEETPGKPSAPEQE